MLAMRTGRRRPSLDVLITAVLALLLLQRAPEQTSFAAGTPTTLLIPLYQAPGPAWTQVEQAKLAHPSVPFYVIINPSNGPGLAADPSFKAGIQAMQADGIVVLGYVASSYSQRSQSAVTADVSNYKAWYNVDGIMVDEMPSTPGAESYYSAVTAFAKSIGMKYVIGNPGGLASASYLSTVDTLVIYEGPSLPVLALASIYPSAPRSSLAAIAFSVPSIIAAGLNAMTAQVGYVYVTDAGLPNPYGVLPSYFSTLVALLDTSNPGVSLTVNAVDGNGNPVSGLWTTLSLAGQPIEAGFTPASYAVTPGATYSLAASNYGSYVFDHWIGGAVSNPLGLTPVANETLTAVYKISAPTTTTTTTTTSATSATSTTSAASSTSARTSTSTAASSTGTTSTASTSASTRSSSTSLSSSSTTASTSQTTASSTSPPSATTVTVTYTSTTSGRQVVITSPATTTTITAISTATITTAATTTMTNTQYSEITVTAVTTETTQIASTMKVEITKTQGPAAGTAPAQLVVRVRNESTPLPGVQLSLEGSDGSVVTGSTNQSGMASFLELQPKTGYALRASSGQYSLAIPLILNATTTVILQFDRLGNAPTASSQGGMIPSAIGVPAIAVLILLSSAYVIVKSGRLHGSLAKMRKLVAFRRR